MTDQSPSIDWLWALIAVVGIPLLGLSVIWLLAVVIEVRQASKELPNCRCGRRVLLGGVAVSDGAGVVHGREVCQPEGEAL